MVQYNTPSLHFKNRSISIHICSPLFNVPQICIFRKTCLNKPPTCTFYIPVPLNKNCAMNKAKDMLTNILVFIDAAPFTKSGEKQFVSLARKKRLRVAQFVTCLSHGMQFTLCSMSPRYMVAVVHCQGHSSRMWICNLCTPAAANTSNIVFFQNRDYTVSFFPKTIR